MKKSGEVTKHIFRDLTYQQIHGDIEEFQGLGFEKGIQDIGIHQNLVNKQGSNGVKAELGDDFCFVSGFDYWNELKIENFIFGYELVQACFLHSIHKEIWGR